MRLFWKVTMLVAVPLLLPGQEANNEGDAAPKAGAAAGSFESSPYQTILNRMPFGDPPPNFNPDALPGTAAAGAAAAGAEEAQLSEDEQQIVSSVRVSILNVTPSGAVAVGFTDSSVQPAVNYYLKVGDKRDVWEVKMADPAEQTVVLVKNGIEATLKVGEGVAEGDKKAKGGRPMLSSRGLVRPGGQAGNNAPQVSAMERLRARRMRSAEDLKAEEDRREAAAAEARKNAAQAAAEREQQREALMQIQEELRRQREEREQRAAQEAQAKAQEAQPEAPAQDAPVEE